MSNWITWDEALSIHVDKIDEQHKELIRRYNELSDAVWEGNDQEKIGDMLNFLAQYTVTHFKDEEELQQLFGYPGYQRHKQIHDAFVEEVETMIGKYQAGELDSDLVIKTVDAVGEWIFNHIKKEDKQIGLFIEKRLDTSVQDTSGAEPRREDLPSLEGQSGPEEQEPSAPSEQAPRKGIIRRFLSWLF